MATILNNEIIAYNPEALVNIFNNTLTIATKKAFRIRGICLPGKGIATTRYLTEKVQPNAGKIEGSPSYLPYALYSLFI